MNYFVATFKTRESLEKFFNEYGGEEFPYEQLEIKNSTFNFCPISSCGFFLHLVENAIFCDFLS